jgi:hypothetical protein
MHMPEGPHVCLTNNKQPRRTEHNVLMYTSRCISVVETDSTCVVYKNDLPTDLAAAPAGIQHAESYASNWCQSAILFS